MEYLLCSRKTNEEEQSIQQFASFPTLLNIHLFQPKEGRENDVIHPSDSSNSGLWNRKEWIDIFKCEKCGNQCKMHLPTAAVSQGTPCVTCDLDSVHDAQFSTCSCGGRLKCSVCALQFKVRCICGTAVDASKFKCRDCTIVTITRADSTAKRIWMCPTRQTEGYEVIRNCYKCSVCFKAFSSEFTLKNHKEVHSTNRKRNHKCLKCEAAFFTAAKLVRHQLKHTHARPFKCTTCSKSFKSQDSLNTHRIIHTGSKDFECSVCGKKFLMEQNMKSHELTHSSDRGRPYKCTICEAAFFSKGTLQRHEQYVHTESRPHKCSKCSKRFKCKLSLRNHLVVHTDMKLFQCPVCEKAFKTVAVLNKHKLVHSIKREKSYKCTKCEAAFHAASNLKHHLDTVHRDVNLHFQCSICPKTFNTKGNLSRHVKQHTSTKDFICLVCQKSFFNKEDLKRHQLTHSSEREPTTCPICGKEVLHLSLHMKWHSTVQEGPKHKCRQCNSMFLNQSHLSRHVKSVHSEERPYQCELCGNAYKSIYHLKRHSKERHQDTSTKHFNCLMCHKTFFSKDVLKRHQLTHSSEREPTTCSVCGKEVLHLVQHMKWHSTVQEGPKHKCRQCDSEFYSSHHLSRHVKSVHSDRGPYQCELCGNGYKSIYHLKRHSKECH